MTETPDPYAPPPQQPAQPPPPQPYGQPYPQQPYPQQPHGEQPYAQQGQPQAPYPGYPAPQGPSSGLAIGALVVGIVSVLAFWIPIVGVAIGLVAVVLGILGWRRANRGTAGGKAMAVVGTILGLLAILAGIAIGIFLIWFLRATSDCYDSAFTDQQVSDCIEQVLEDRWGVNFNVN